MMHIFTPVWGDKNLNLLKNALGKSLTWPENKRSVQNAAWSIVTSDQENADKAVEIVKSFDITKNIYTYIANQLLEKNSDKGIIILNVLFSVIEMCLRDNTPMLMATPDFIYGDGTIETFKRIGSKPGSCVAIPHIRVLPSILKKLDFPPTNTELISHALNHAHISWTASEASNKNSRSYRSALVWRKLCDNAIALQHLMPSPFFVNFIKEDLDYLKIKHDNREAGFGAWDHKWPKFLIENGRLKVIGSSDAAVMVEITDFDANVPPIDPPDKPSQFFNQDFHNNVQKQFISIFRSEDDFLENHFPERGL